MNRLDQIEILQRQIDLLRENDKLRSQKLTSEQSVDHLLVLLTKAKTALEVCAPKNGAATTIRKNVMDEICNELLRRTG